MGSKSTRKGKLGECEFISLVCELTDASRSAITRNQAQAFEGGHDILGLAPFAVEVKRYATCSVAQRQRWWLQTVEQARESVLIPALAYRADRQPEWRVIVPLSILSPEFGGGRHDWEHLVDLHPVSFCRMLTIMLEKEILS